MNLKIRLLVLVTFLICNTVLAERVSNNASYKLNIKQGSNIKLDGLLDESLWQTADSAHSFHQNFPYDKVNAKTKTVVRILHDQNFIYIGAICYDTMPEKNYVVQSLRRDFSVTNNDAFAVSIDPNNDLTSGYSFAVSPYNVQREGILAFGGNWGVSTVWDQVWYSATKITSYGWTLEMAIPFTSIRYRSENTNWGINFSRHNLKLNEVSTWAPVPRNFNVSTLAYAGTLKWETNPPKPGKNIVLAPYGIVNGNQDYTRNGPFKGQPGIGLDIRSAVTPSLNLDVTVNPDFSQVEVDRQVTNLSRFSLFFPEQRTFFQENADLFSNFGFSSIRPFFSRRIGLYTNDLNPTTQKVPIIAGARLSGKATETLRIGLLNMQTAQQVLRTNNGTDTTLASQNYTVATFQKDIFKSSNLGFIFVNRQQSRNAESNNNFNRIIGIDYNLASINNLWRGKLFLHKSITQTPLKDQFAHAVWLSFNKLTTKFNWNHEYVGQNYIAETGFTPRLYQFNSLINRTIRVGYWRLEPDFTKVYFPKGKISKYVNNIAFTSYLNAFFLSNNNVLNDGQWQNGISFGFQNSANIEIGHNVFKSNLIYPFQLIGSSRVLEVGAYNFQNTYISFNSNVRSKFNISGNFAYGTFYNANQISVSGNMNFRLQPWGQISINTTFDKLSNTESAQEFLILSPRLDLTFTNALFLTTFLQVNSQSKNTNLNIRLQWRYRPMSDFFFVLTDNYFNNNFAVRNRAIALKMVYWLGV